MAIETPHKHIGFNIQFDALIQRGTIHVNPQDWDAIHANTIKSASEFHGDLDQAAESTELNATQVGPVSGPDAGTGPLIPVGATQHPQDASEPEPEITDDQLVALDQERQQ